MMKNMFAKIGATTAVIAMVLAVGLTSAFAASGYPINKPREQSWSFAGPFGHYDKGQLQRGLKNQPAGPQGSGRNY